MDLDTREHILETVNKLFVDAIPLPSEVLETWTKTFSLPENFEVFVTPQYLIFPSQVDYDEMCQFLSTGKPAFTIESPDDDLFYIGIKFHKEPLLKPYLTNLHK